MNYVKCHACPAQVQCDEASLCLNTLVTARQKITSALAQYDATMWANAATRAASPAWGKPIVPILAQKTICPHNQRSGIGICLACGDWK